MKAKRRLACAAIVTLLVSSTSLAQPEDDALADEDGPPASDVEAGEMGAEREEEEAEPKNGLLFGFTHAFRLLRDRELGGASESRRAENVYGFLFGYERVLHRHVALSVIKPFYFNRELIESPLEIVVSGIYRKNNWEPFLGAGVISTIASVDQEESEAEGKVVEFAFGLLFIAGFKYFFTPNWGIELEVGYEYVPKGGYIEQAFADSYQGVYFF